MRGGLKEEDTCAPLGMSQRGDEKAGVFVVHEVCVSVVVVCLLV